MKALLCAVLLVSIGGNFALLTVQHDDATPRDVPREGTAPLGQVTSRETAVMQDNAVEGRKEHPGDGARSIAPWAASEELDPAILRDRLRAAGFPEPIVKALVAQRLEAAFARKLEARTTADLQRPFWQTHDPRELEERRREERAAFRELRSGYREVLGEAANAFGWTNATARFAFLPPDKAALIASVESDYAEISADSYQDGLAWPMLGTDEDRDRRQLIEEEKRADIAAVLTPEELERYDLHLSSTANSVRNRLRSIEPTEEEFRAVYELQKEFDDRFGAIRRPASREVEQARSAASRELEEQIKTALGEARQAELEQARSQSYRAAVKIAEHFNLPRETAAVVRALEVEFGQRREAAVRDAATPEDRAEALRTLAAEAGPRLERLLTTEGARVFRDHGGSWLRNLEEQSQRGASPRR